MAQAQYRVFVSHGGEDSWVAAQIAEAVRGAGAIPFLDESDIAKGENFRKRVHDEVGRCHELIALFTPWSVKRSWVWIEMGAAWGQAKPVIAVFYGMRASDLEDSGQGKAILEDINIIGLNEFNSYCRELTTRVRGFSR